MHPRDGGPCPPAALGRLARSMAGLEIVFFLIITLSQSAPSPPYEGRRPRQTPGLASPGKPSSLSGTQLVTALRAQPDEQFNAPGRDVSPPAGRENPRSHLGWAQGCSTCPGRWEFTPLGAPRHGAGLRARLGSARARGIVPRGRQRAAVSLLLSLIPDAAETVAPPMSDLGMRPRTGHGGGALQRRGGSHPLGKGY